jgi:hypothetical protein
MAIAQTQLGATATQILDSGTNKFAAVMVALCNTDAANVITVSLYISTSVDALDSKAVLKDYPIKPKDTFFFSLEKFLLDSNLKLVGLASTPAKVTVNCSYIAI